MAKRRDLEIGGNKTQNDLAEPFIDDHSKNVDGSEQTNQNESITMVLISTAVAVCGSLEFGTCVGFSAPTQLAICNDLNLSVAQSMALGAVICISGWLAIFFAMGSLLLDTGRFFTGYGIGIFTYVVPIYVAEIAPKELRGGLTTLNQFMIVTGSSISFLLGTVVSWRTLAFTTGKK
ncbi:sugar transporter ERD6-like protein 16, partial [Tanacetum coccineum]